MRIERLAMRLSVPEGQIGSNGALPKPSAKSGSSARIAGSVTPVRVLAWNRRSQAFGRLSPT